MSRSERIAQQLGMSHGAATNKLRKNILFSFAQRLNEDICFKCGEKIESVNDLSIEHKLPWENRSVELFWDLSNITFSHSVCNRPHIYRAPEIINPEGLNWCHRCKSFLVADRFHKVSTVSDGLSKICKTCKTRSDTRRNHAKKVYGPVI